MMAAIENAHTRAAFLHFFDVHFLELKQAELYEREVAQEARLATRLALLSSDQVLVPAASYFETRICRKIVREFTPIFKDGAIWLVGGAANAGEFIYNKLRQYDSQSQQYREYSTVDLSGLPPFRSRTQSSTRDIKTQWIEELNAERSPHVIAEGTGFTIPKDFERRWEQVPANLEGKAFIVPYVAPLLLGSNQHPTVLNRLHYVINEALLRKLCNRTAGLYSFRISFTWPLRILFQAIGAPIHFRTLLKQLRREGLLQPIMTCSPEELILLKNDERWIRCLLNTSGDNIHNGCIAHQIVGKEIKEMEALRSFIVHGT